MKNVKLVSGLDWQGLYVDGVLAAEGHTLSAHTVLRVLGLDNANVIFPNESWLEDYGHLPTYLKDVVRETTH